jgi:hypothetical protein
MSHSHAWTRTGSAQDTLLRSWKDPNVRLNTAPDEAALTENGNVG